MNSIMSSKQAVSDGAVWPEKKDQSRSLVTDELR